MEDLASVSHLFILFNMRKKKILDLWVIHSMTENVSWMDVVILLAQRVYSGKRNRTWKDVIMSPSLMQALALGSLGVQEAHFFCQFGFDIRRSSVPWFHSGGRRIWLQIFPKGNLVSQFLLAYTPHGERNQGNLSHHQKTNNSLHHVNSHSVAGCNHSLMLTVVWKEAPSNLIVCDDLISWQMGASGGLHS